MLTTRLALSGFLALAAPAIAAEPVWQRIGPEGGSISAFLAVPSRPATLYAGFIDGGIYRSDDRGATWRYAGAGSGRLRIADLAAEGGSREILYAASGSLGVAKTSDGGRSWKASARGIPLADQLPVVAVATDPKTPGVVYAAARTAAIYKTVDGGRTWKKLPAGAPLDVSRLISDPRVRDTLYALTAAGRLWKTTNGGRTWRRADRSLPAGLSVLELRIDPRNSSALFVRAYDDETTRALRSRDGGKTWRTIGGAADDEVRSLAIDPLDSKTVYMGTNDAVLRSLDGGTTWAETESTPDGSQFQVYATRGAVIAQPLGAVIFRTTDGGVHWSTVRGIRALSARHVAVAPGPRLYTRVLSSGSIELRSDDEGLTWQPLEPLDDNPFRSFGLLFELDPSAPATIYAGFTEKLARSTDGGDRFEAVASPPCILPLELAIDPSDGGNLYLSGEPRGGGCPTQGPELCAVFRKLGGADWECIDANLPGLGLPISAVDPFDGATLYAQFPGALFRSDDHGTNWALTALIDFLASLTPDPTRPGVLFAGVLGHTGRSEDRGESWDFTSSGIPQDEYVLQILVDPSNGDRLYARVTQDVYRSDDAGRTWRRAGAGLGESVMLEIAFDPDDSSILYAAAFGGGLLRLDQP